MIISNNDEWQQITLSLGVQNVMKAECIKFLGYIDTSYHGDIICYICALDIVGRILHYPSTKYRKMIYYCLIHSHLTNLTIIWRCTYQSRLQPLLTLQNKANKRIFKLPRFQPTNDL